MTILNRDDSSSMNPPDSMAAVGNSLNYDAILAIYFQSWEDELGWEWRWRAGHVRFSVCATSLGRVRFYVPYVGFFLPSPSIFVASLIRLTNKRIKFSTYLELPGLKCSFVEEIEFYNSTFVMALWMHAGSI